MNILAFLKRRQIARLKRELITATARLVVTKKLYDNAREPIPSWLIRSLIDTTELVALLESLVAEFEQS